MKDYKPPIPSKTNPNLVSNHLKILCEKCGGSGNLKTPENSRRTCLRCFGKGYMNF